MPVRKKRQETGPQRQTALNSRSLKPAPASDNDIARRAYELFIQRGGEHGKDVEDWLRAKRELRGDV